jgi:predicted component of type VI protein secretion system
MGAYGWGKDHSVIEWLFAEGYRFDFFQAVRLLETLYSWELSSQNGGGAAKKRLPPSSTEGAQPSTVSAVEKADAPKDFVRFKSEVALNFPTSDVSKVKLHHPKDSLEPADEPTTEMICNRVRARDLSPR